MEAQMPSDKMAEEIILGACMSSIDALNKAVDVLQPHDFYHGKNSLIFGACRERYLQNKEVSPYAVIKELGTSIEPQDAEYILNVRNYFEHDALLDEYIDSIAEKANLRNLYFSSQMMTKDVLHEDAETTLIVEKYVTQFSDTVSRRLRKTQTIQEVLENFHDGKDFNQYLDDKMERVKAGLSPFNGVRSYYPRLDETLGSFQNGCLHYIGARTSMGKTTFLMNVIQNIMKNEPDTCIAFLSLEMLKTTIAEKLLCMRAGVAYTKIANGTLVPEEYERLKEAQKMMRGKLILDDSPMDISMLSARVRRLVNVDGAKIIFIDYLTCIKATDKLNSNHERVNQVSKGLLALTKELNVPIVCLAQLNRALISRNNKSPTLADFRESGSIEEDADVCMLLHRPKYYDEASLDPYTHLIVAKSRLMGELKIINFEWNLSMPGNYSELGSIRDIASAAVAGETKEKKDEYSYSSYRNW